MIDLSNVRAPGWQKVVAELASPASDDAAYLARLVTVLAQVSGSRQAALLEIGPAQAPAESGETSASSGIDDPEPRVVFVWPPRAMNPGASGGGAGIECERECLSAARAAVRDQQVQAFGLGREDMMYESPATSGSSGAIVAVPVPAQPGAAGAEGGAPVGTAARYAITLVLEQRSRPALQTTLALVEVLAGYVHTHGLRQRLKQTRAASAALDLATRLIAAINLAPSFEGAAMQLCNDLCRQLSAERVSIGWIKGRMGVEASGVEASAVQVIAMSDTEHVDRRTAMVLAIQKAMDECLDQEQAVLFPVPPAQGEGGDAVLGSAIALAHRELSAGDAGRLIASLPLRVDERVLGVVMIEARRDTAGAAGINPATVELVQSCMDLVSPVLRIRKSDDRWLHQRAYASAIRAGSWLVGPKHTAWKLAGAAVVALVLTATFVTVPYRVGADAVLQPREKRVVSAPFEGVVARVAEGIAAGRRVEAGELLMELDTSELTLRALDAESEVVQFSKQADEALRQNKTSEAQQAQAKADQARARADLMRYYVNEARILAPVSGTIIAGDVRDKVGARVQTGTQLFEIAALDDMVVVAKVSDRDIALVEAAGGVGGEGAAAGRGYVAARSRPAESFAFTIERIVPLGEPMDGRNVFEVRGKLDRPAGWMRPGMEGVARLQTGDRSLMWIGSRRILDQLRLWLWW